MDVFLLWVFCVLCDGLISRPEESYRLWWCVCVWCINLKNEEPMARDWAASGIGKKKKVPFFKGLNSMLCRTKEQRQQRSFCPHETSHLQSLMPSECLYRARWSSYVTFTIMTRVSVFICPNIAGVLLYKFYSKAILRRQPTETLRKFKMYAS